MYKLGKTTIPSFHLGGRPVHELDSHLSVVRCQLLRLLTALQRHAQELATKAAEWTPWNYREKLERIVSLSDSA